MQKSGSHKEEQQQTGESFSPSLHKGSCGCHTKTRCSHFPAFASYSCLFHIQHVYISRDEMEMIDAKEVFLLIVVALTGTAGDG